jgi:hypothetical protein
MASMRVVPSSNPQDPLSAILITAAAPHTLNTFNLSPSLSPVVVLHPIRFLLDDYTVGQHHLSEGVSVRALRMCVVARVLRACESKEPPTPPHTHTRTHAHFCFSRALKQTPKNQRFVLVFVYQKLKRLE